MQLNTIAEIPYELHESLAPYLSGLLLVDIKLLAIHLQKDDVEKFDTFVAELSSGQLKVLCQINIDVIHDYLRSRGTI